MPERTDVNPHTAIRWPLFIVLAVALVGVSLLTGLWVQASPLQETSTPPDTSRPTHDELDARSAGVLTETQIFLPLVTACRLQGVTLTAPAEPGTIGLTHTFTVEVAAPNVALPLTYTWQATGQEPVAHSAGLTDTLDLLWELTGSKVITVEVSNGGCTIPVTVAFDVTTRGMIVYESKVTPGSEQHDLLLVHNEHPDVVFNLTNTPDVDEGGPTWSPDGNWIAYSAGDLSGWDRAIYKIDLSTRQIYSVTDHTTDDRWPAWSPSGTRIAFMRNQAGLPAGFYIPDIYVMDVDGGNLQQLTDWDYGDEHPAWSPNGQSIAFVSDRYYAGRDLWMMDADGSNERQLLDTPGTDEVYPTWGPEEWIYYTWRVVDGKDEQLYRMNPANGDRVKVFDDNFNRYIASFAPDGECFSFYSILGDIAGHDKEVWKWCTGYTDPVNLTDNDVSDEYSAWSPAP
ncbi:MAG: PD40 domain-containing protein [Anaerolineae bacterium]|nr:PD40 domain-containing protein [Anaerolineae bacterium]